MYSLMSRRVTADSSSNRNSASALVSSVLPTPVGPRNRKEAIGRFGSCNPARARRTACATAAIASSWPTTRALSASSICNSLPRSPSSIFSTGTPVQRDTTAAICSSVTASSCMTPRPSLVSAAASRRAGAGGGGGGGGEPLFEVGDDAVGELAGPGPVAAALHLLQLDARL